MKLKILFLQKRPLFPADTGGKIRTLNVVRHLAQWCDVTYLCNLKPGEEPAVAQMEALGMKVETFPWTETPRHSWKFGVEVLANLASPHPFSVNKDFDPALQARAMELAASGSFDLCVCDFVQMARNALGLPLPKLLFQHNVEAQVFERLADEATNPIKRWLLRHEAGKMRKFEGRAGRCFDSVVAVSDRDRDTFKQWYAWNHVDVIDTAVDVDYFAPQTPAEALPSDQAAPAAYEKVVFIGSLDWLPNVMGLRWFAQEVWPKVRAERPKAVCTLVGRNPGSAVQELASVPGIQIAASVPDVRPYLAEAAACVVPLRSGGGTRLKIYEALAMGKAVLSTQLGAEGLPVEDGVQLLLRDSAEEFAEGLLDLFRHPVEREAMAARGGEWVRERYSSETVAKQFLAACERLARRAGRRACKPPRPVSAA